MANVAYGNVVFGLQDIKVTNIGGTTQEDLGAATLAEFTPELQGGVLKGDDANKASVFFIVGGKIKFTAGEYSSAAVGIMLGTSPVTSGITPNEVTTIQMNAGLRLPYFKLYSQAFDEGSGDFHSLFNKVKLSGIPSIAKLENGNLRMGEFEAECFDDGSNGVVKLVQNETATAVPAS